MQNISAFDYTSVQFLKKFCYKDLFIKVLAKPLTSLADFILAPEELFKFSL